jgi:hypothetical protein
MGRRKAVVEEQPQVKEEIVQKKVRKKTETVETVEEAPKKKFAAIEVGDIFLCEFKQYKYVIEVQWQKNNHYWLHFQYLKSKTSKSKKEEEKYGIAASISSANKIIEEKAYQKISKAQYKKYLTEGI